MIENILLSLESMIDPTIEITLLALSFWWIYVPIILIVIAAKLWLIHKREEYKSELEWSLIEVRVPREVEKIPKSMEQIFAAMHEIQSKVKTREKWLEGKVKDWMSFEIVGRAGSIHFLIRVLSKYRNLLESSVYAQYPEAEITLIPEVDDYVNSLPDSLPNQKYDLWGTEMVLAKEDGYPIRTYEYFEHKEEEKRIDPIANIMETMSALDDDEAIWLQILLRPAPDDWVKDQESIINKLMGKEEKKTTNPIDWGIDFLHGIAEFVANFFVAFFEPPQWSEPSDKDDSRSRSDMTPGKRDVLKAVENKISKAGFEGAIRFVYIDDRDAFTKSNISSVMGSLRQFNTNNMNALKPNKESMPGGKPPLKERKVLHKKRKLYSHYKTRDFPEKYSIFNTEELATLYHFPITGVKSPKLQKTEFKRGGPPTDLPLFE